MKARGWTQVDLANEAGISQGAVSRAIKGGAGIGLGTYQAISEALGVPLHYLFIDERNAQMTILMEAFEAGSPERRRMLLDLAQWIKDRDDSPNA